MSEIHITTTDDAFVGDLNAAGIEGVRAKYRPTMAFDSTEHILQIVVSLASSVGAALFTEWLKARLQSGPHQPPMIINNHITVTAEHVALIVQQVQTAKHSDDKK